MNDRSPQEQKRIILLLSGLGDIALGLFFVLVALRIIPFFSDSDSSLFFLAGGLVFTIGAFMIIFNLSPRE